MSAALLLFGVELGGFDRGWNVVEADEQRALHLPWYTQDDDETFAEQAMRALLASVGFTESASRSDGYWGRRLDAEDALGVTMVEREDRGRGTGYVLAAHEIRVEIGNISHIDMQLLEIERARARWEVRIAAAAGTLQLTPTEPARWTLTVAD